MIGYMRGRVDMYVNPKEGPNCPGPAFPYHEAAFRGDSDAPAVRMGAGYSDHSKVSGADVYYWRRQVVGDAVVAAAAAPARRSLWQSRLL